MIRRSTAIIRRWTGLALCLPVLACGSNEYAPPPPVRVTVEQPRVQDVTRYIEYTGTTRAVESVEVRARVKGFLQSMEFAPGAYVEAGSPLFQIDPEPFEITLQAANAELVSNEAEQALAQTEYERIQTMYKKKATSELKLIQARAKRDQARAAVSSSEAKVKGAQLDLEYASVKAPITGRVGRKQVDVGNLVGSSEATLLTNMVRYSPLHVYFHVSEADLLDLQEIGRLRRLKAGAEYANRPPTTIEIGRSNDEGFPYVGEIDFTALEIDPGTGTFEARGVLPNEGPLDEIIVPGTFVRVRVPVGESPGALLVTERALGADQSGRFLLVANSENIVEQRRIVIGPQIDGYRVIEKGLRAEDRVIVGGLQRARPGATVEPIQNGTDG